MTKFKFSKKLISTVLAIALFMTCLPLSVLAATSAASTGTPNIITDPGTAHTWESMIGTDADGNRYAGRVWVDKSIYTDGQVAILNTSGQPGSTFNVSLDDDEAFQVIFSALGSSMSTTTTKSSSAPMDVVLILDNSSSMADVSNGTSRMKKVIDSANDLITNLLSNDDVRLGITAYSQNAQQLLAFGTHTNGVKLSVTNDTNTYGGVIYAKDNNGKTLGQSSGYKNYTNMQAGYDLAMNMLESASDVNGRTPIVILLTDGAANTAVNNSFYDISKSTAHQIYYSNNIDPTIALSTLLSSSYKKATVEDHYGKKPMVYGIGVDLSNTDGSNAIINPRANFNSSNVNQNIRTAYNYYVNSWLKGETVTLSANRITFKFDHNYPAGSTVTDKDVEANINYVDTYYNVKGAELENAFKLIYEEISSGVFNPITSTQTVSGGTGIKNTPLIYVDNIGQYMEIKKIQSVTLFGSSYDVIKNADGTYTVDAATGTNPTTNEFYNTSEDIKITVTKNSDGTQKLQIEINQEILPILLEKVVDKNVGNEHTVTINQIVANPLRIYYTVGISSDILLSNGEIDLSKIDSNYPYINNATGEISFYGHSFGNMNNEDADNNGLVDNGDSHVGFKPSKENRYYYHQENQGIFSAVTAKDGSTIVWEEDRYGIIYDEDKYDITWLNYDEYKNLNDSDTVYTYVTYYRPTTSTTDAATAAEEVTYLVYTNWGYLKESVSFYDHNAKTYINFEAGKDYVTGQIGYAIPVENVEDVISEYVKDNPNAEIYAVLGVGSLRTSRLHNMKVEKNPNITEVIDNRYVPEYTYETSTIHNGNDVVVWLGNNGKYTTAIDTGIALTKNVTEAIGNANDTYALTVTVPSGVTADPIVKDSNGNNVTSSISTYDNNVLTVNLKAGQTVYISGIPAGTTCIIDENIPQSADYYIADKTNTVTIPTISEVINGAHQFVPASVTNAPNKYGNLYITKELESTHNIPSSIEQDSFNVSVNIGTSLAGKKFMVSDSSATQPYEVTVDNNGNIELSIKAKHTIEIFKLPAGTVATITEKLSADQDKIFDVSYRTLDRSGNQADTDNTVTITADSNSTAVIINTYAPLSTKVDLDIEGTKNFGTESDASLLPGGSFEFKVQEWNENTNEWIDISGKIATTIYNAGEYGTKTFKIEDVLNGITFDKVGTWSYQVLEVKGNVQNVTYDRTLYTFTVTVVDNDGTLVATVTDINNTAITDGSYDVYFENTYHTAPVSIDIVKDVNNKSGDNTVSKAGFAFTAIQTDSNWNKLANGSILTVYSDAAGEARFTTTCTNVGVYYFVITETNSNNNGWTYSTAEYRVTVTVSEDNGNLTAVLSIVAKDGTTASNENASVNGNSGKISFVNTYDPTDATINLDTVVKKSLTGKKLNAGDFTFNVYKNGTSEVVLTGTNNADGNVSFNDVLKFDKAGKYEFDIAEVKGAVAGITYDNTIYDLVVEVRNDLTTGKLVAEYYFEDSTTDTITFNNTYSVKPTVYTIGGTKILHGRSLSVGEFTFELYEGSTLLQTVTNKSDGTFSFAEINYDKAGTYTYTIKEVVGNVPGVTYNGADNPITVIITVTDTDAVLTANASISNENIKFENTYKANSATVKFNGTKTLVGDVLSDNTFKFDLYKTNNEFNVSGLTPIESVKNTDGKFSFSTLTFTAAGNYFYVITEDSADPIDNVVYDNTQHLFHVIVTDIGNGQLQVVVKNLTNGSSTQPAANTTSTVSFTNAKFEEVAKKEVYIANSSVQVDGKKVNEGDILTYFITYTNYTGEAVIVDIMDTIPDYTSYVANSASHNGSHVGNHINWILNVGKGETVKVSFDVKVDKTDVIVDNTAVIRDGINTYTTNEVISHTINSVTEKDVFSPDDTTISINGKKVYEKDELVYVIKYVNSSNIPIDVKITDTIPGNTTYVEGSADNGGVYNNGIVTWNIENVPAWSTVTVTFKVKVNEGIGAKVIENTATVEDETNSYITNKVTNYTVKDEVEKTVYIDGNTSANIDGKVVNKGDTLIYAISYTNTSTEKATVSITDTIPKHTAYVEGSADNGGIHDNGTLNWTLEVAPGATVTVTFKVVVDIVTDVNITNKATITEGNNTYTTNEVSVTVPTNPNSPQTGVNTRFDIWAILLFVSTSGLIGTAVYEQKKKKI